MPRSSRHRCHRSHKHSRDHSDSEEDGSPRARRSREEEPAASSGARVSRDPEPEKRRSSHEHSEKELVGSSNGDFSGEHEKKRKERVEEVVAADRWNGGEENDHKRSKAEEFGPLESDKSSKSKLLAAESKGRSSRRRESLNERDEDSGGKNDSAKQKSGKDSGRRESSSQYKDGKLRDRMVRDNDKDREAQDSRHDKSDDLQSRKHGSKSGSCAEELATKKYTNINERQVQDILHSPETEKGFEKHVKKRDDSEDKDKWLDESRDTDDRRVSSRDDHSKNRSYKDERHEDSKYRGKYRDDNDRDQKHHDDSYQDERSSKDCTSDKSDKWHLRDENKPLEGHYRKAKLQDTDHDGTFYVDDHDTKLKDSRGRKRYSDEMEDHSDLKPRGGKERCEVLEKNTLGTSRTGSRNDKPRSQHQHPEKADSSPRNNRLKSSISSSVYVKDHNRDVSKLAESAHRESASEVRLCSIPASKGDCLTSSGFHDRISGTQSGKLAPKENIHSGEFFLETASASKYDKTPRLDACTSPNQSRRRSPSANSGRLFSERSPSNYHRTARQHHDIEVGQRSSISKGRHRRELALEKPIIDDISHTDVCARESTPVGSSSINRSGYLSDCSPNPLLPPPPIGLGIDNPSVLGPYQDDNRAQSGDHKSFNRYKRVGDNGFGRGHGNAWKGPATNGFVSLQHGPPPAGFHPAMSQFSVPPLFGVRPSMDLIHGGVSYHMHDEAERFSAHGRPFGWHNPVNQLCHPHLQMWDGSNGMFNNEPHIHGGPEWDENSQLIGSRGWEMGSEMWKGQNSNNMDIHISKKEQESSTHSLTDELAQSKCLPTESIEAKRSSNTPPAKSAVESPQKVVTKKMPEPSNIQGDEISNYGANYLSRIDISPDLVDSELYQRCTSLLGTLDIKCSLTTYGCFQTIKDGSIVELKGISSSFFPTAKDDVFKRAMSLYQKKNERVNGKHAVTTPAYSEEMEKESPEATDNRKVQGVANWASLEKTPLSDADSTDNTKVRDNTIVQDLDCPGNAKDEKSDFISDAVIHSNSSEACEAVMEECSVNVSRIHNSLENTH